MMSFIFKQKKFWIRPLTLMALMLGLAGISSHADTTMVADTTKSAMAAAAPAVDSALMARVADLEAYVNNTAPAKLTGVPGPGHNAWMMTSAVSGSTTPGFAPLLMMQAR